MPTVFSKRLTFEFSENGFVLGRATFNPGGPIELEFPDPELASRFKGYLCDPQLHHGPVFDVSDIEKVSPELNPLHFIEACQALTNVYGVRRIL